MSRANEQRIELDGAVLFGIGRDRTVLRLAGELARASTDRFAARVELAGIAAWLKSDPIPPRARWRLTLRRWLGKAAPCVAEYNNLSWLREHAFGAPEPLAAGVLVERGWVGRQLVATRWIGAHRTLEEALRDAAPTQRAAWIDQLARQVAHLHGLGFVHRDLYLRNLLLDAAQRLVFIDCRRGGEPRPRRGVDYDLGCLMLEGAGELTFDEQREFFARYFSERAAHGVPAQPRASLAAANYARDALLERISRAPARWRSPSPPRAQWPWRELAAAL